MMTMKLPQIFLGLFFATSLKVVFTRGVLRQNGACSWTTYETNLCKRSDFSCADGSCVHRKLFCDGRNDCPDGSDEKFCEFHHTYDCRAYRAMTECPSGNGRCILKEWLCDGIRDCSDGSDEYCDVIKDDEHAIKLKALDWLRKQRSQTAAVDVWGASVDKLAVVFHLTSNEGNEQRRREMAYELSIQLLSRLSQTKLSEIPPYDLASYVNAFLVTCLNPRKFHGLDIVSELRSRVDVQNYTNPYLLLTLCNAGDTITELDEMKLLDAFWTKRRSFWTDIRALAVMALACAYRQAENDMESEHMHELVSELKHHQYTNGSIESLQTTSLVMQALLSAESHSDVSTDFDEAKALQHMKTMQLVDGSFGSFLNTYYVLPVLNCKSLANISSNHCPEYPKQETATLEELGSLHGPKIRVRYSIWIGSESDLERNLALRIPANLSFYNIMNIAADSDPRYRFDYIMQEGKPYVTALSGLQDDPEKGKFWFLYTVEEGKPPVLSEESPADVVPVDNEHFVMWYRSGSWSE